jgi:hypothetical protein
MFELHVVVAGIIMFNIMELIMEIVPNYPTEAAASGTMVGNIFMRWGSCLAWLG